MIPNLEHNILLMTHVGRCFKNINLSSSLSCPGTCIKLLWEIQHFRSRSSYILTAVAKTGSMVLSNGSHDDVQLQWRGSMALGSSFCKSITSLPFRGSRYPLSRCGLLPSSSASFSPQRLHLFKLQQITTPFSPSQNNLITFGSQSKLEYPSAKTQSSYLSSLRKPRKAHTLPANKTAGLCIKIGRHFCSSISTLIGMICPFLFKLCVWNFQS